MSSNPYQPPEDSDRRPQRTAFWIVIAIVLVIAVAYGPTIWFSVYRMLRH